jgi:hypothetical protein
MGVASGVAGDAVDVPRLQQKLELGGTFLGRGAPEEIL